MTERQTKRKEYRRAYYLRNRDYFRTYHRRKKETYRNSYLLRNYGITHEQYESMLAAQDFRCAICRQLPKENKRLCVDHVHDGSGRVRELLCDTCNTTLGKFNDNPELFKAAIAYLEKHSPGK